MIRLVTSRRLTTLETERDQAAEAARDTEIDRDRHCAAEEELRRELALVQVVLDQTHCDWGAAEATVVSLRGEVTELVEELKAASETPSRVYILTHLGELHSVHLSEDAARARAAGEDAASENWQWKPTPRNTPLWQSTWKVSPLVVSREGATR